jgi:uncharacterized protein (DUF1800 family)
MRSIRFAAALPLGVLFSFGVANAQVAPDPVFAAGFENADIPATDAEAARFLTQASFGPTKAEIAHVRAVGYAAWIDEQMALPATFAQPYLAALTPPSPGLTQGYRVDRWFNTAAVGADQLRQRMAFALSQTFVISDQSGALNQDVLGVANYWDMLANEAFGNYRTLLEDVTRSPQMGLYLSHLRNQKATLTTQPDENYAREVMQLFSIGLEFRHPDFSPILDGSNNPIPTYDQAVVTEMAQVFTGFSYPCPNPPGGCSTYSSLFSAPISFNPMACFPRYHDLTDKTLFALAPGGLPVVLPAGPTCPNTGATPQQITDCIAYCNADLKGALDALGGHPGAAPFDGHPNVAPFLARQLIERFVTSNPSPAYIQRIATVFQTSGGNLGQTLRALLLDPDARNAPTANSGKVREPIMKLIAAWRAWNAQMQPDGPTTGVLMGTRQPEAIYLQRPLGAPSVFNFYEPDYQQPGAIAALNLYSPELQIVNESTIATTANNLYTNSWNSYLGMPSPPANRPLLDLSPLTSATSNAAMIDEANLRMLYGQMSLSMRASLLNLLDNNMAGSTPTQRALALIHLIELSPEFDTQR